MSVRKITDRRGFTLLELLVVMTVISLMLALLVGASFRFVVSARSTATAGTITKVNGILQDRVNQFRAFDFTDSAYRARDAWNLANPADPIMTLELAEVLMRKTRFQKAFPQSFAEVTQAGLQTKFFGAATIPPPSPYLAKYESGIVLYAFLTKGETFGAHTPADDAFGGAEVKIGPETGNLPCLIDAWGEPLRFYRWPTRLLRCGEQDFDNNGTFDDYNLNGTQQGVGFGCPAIRPFSLRPGPTPASLLLGNLPVFERTQLYARGVDGLPGVALIDDDGINGVDDVGEIGFPDTDDPEPLNTDPDDPTFQLSAFLFDPNVSAALRTTRQTNFSSGFHDFYTFHTPLIVSAGQDKVLGLFEPADTVNFGHLASPTAIPAAMNNLFDNITNLNQRAGGK